MDATNFEKIQTFAIQFSINLVAAILIFIIGKFAAQILTNLMEKILVKSKVETTLALFAKNITYFGFMAFVIIASLNKLGVETNSFIAIIGAAGLAIGLALQGSLSNFAAGVMIILFHPFRVNDHIETSGADGRVTEIQIFNTILITKDNKTVIIPNAKVTGDKIIVHPRG